MVAMADLRMVTVTPMEVSTLKEALYAQQELLQKVNNELEAEREASATAASETLSVISRLQEEKAAVKLEAEHYKRLAEEKMCHAEESFAVIEDVINAREMEVADLEYELECYRYKLLSMGCIDPGDGDLIYPEHLLRGKGNMMLGRLGRRNSEPVLVTFEGCISDVGCSSKWMEKQTAQDMDEAVLDSDKKTREGVNLYGEQIKELNEKVKGILEGNKGNVQNEPRCPLPRIRVGKNANKATTSNEMQQTKNPGNTVKRDETGDHQHSENTVKKEETVDHSCSQSVLDVFEVPQADPDCRPSGSSSNSTENKAKHVQEIDDTRDSIHSKGLKPCAKNENDWPQKQACQTSNVCPVEPTNTQPTQHAAESTPDLNHFNQINAQTTQCPAESAPASNHNQIPSMDVLLRLADISKQEEMKLLKEIHEKLNLLHQEIRSQRAEKSPRRKDSPPLHLPEAMLYFWL